MSTHFVPPKGSGLSKHTIANFAEDVAKSLSFEPGGGMEEIISCTGGKLVVGSSGVGDHESGSIVARALDDYTIFLSSNTSRQRDRFTIAHELEHLILHFPPIEEADPEAVMRATRWVDDNDPDQKRAEWEANWFAAAFLMPQAEVIEAFGRGRISAIQSTFDVSASAAETRARTLGLT